MLAVRTQALLQVGTLVVAPGRSCDALQVASLSLSACFITRSDDMRDKLICPAVACSLRRKVPSTKRFIIPLHELDVVRVVV